MKLDVKDKKIICELDLNPKLSTSKLGKKVRVSQQVADYRLKKLSEKKVITGFGTIINQGKLGYEQYRIFFQLNAQSEKEKSEILKELKLHKNVYWSALVGGKWDLFTTVFVRHYEELEEFLDSLFKKFPKTLIDYDASYSIYHEFYPHKYLFDKNKNWEATRLNFANSQGTVKIDQLDRKIIKSIANNCRQASLELGSKLGVTYKTIQNRVKSLEEKGIIRGYRLFIDSEKMAFSPYLLLLSFRSFGLQEEKKMLSFATQHKLITQSTKLFGNYSLIFHVRAKSNQEVQDLIIELRKNFPVIGNYEVVPIFKDLTINLLPS